MPDLDDVVAREPQPKPEPPDMDGLFPRPERGTRMYVQPTEAPQRVLELAQ